LFPDGMAKSPAVTRDDAQSYTLNAVAQSHLFSGRAATFYRRADEIDDRTSNAHNRRTGLSNLGETTREIGALREAAGVLRQALVLSGQLDAVRQGITLQNLGRVLGSTAAHRLGRVALYRSRHLFMEQGAHQWEGLTSAHLAEFALWIGDLIKAGIWAERAWQLAIVQRLERDFIRAALLQGRAALGGGDLSRADERLYHALTRTRAVNVVELELPALIAIAELDLKRGDSQKAKASLDDVWEAAERGPYPLHLADAFNVLAAIEMVGREKRAAIAAATSAFKAAWCDGPPYAYHWGLEKAKAQLAALGAPEPVLPPFDESKFEPMPEVEINPKDKYWVDPDKLD
jgi:tetratricopeptide (TPR) repeat protein